MSRNRKPVEPARSSNDEFFLDETTDGESQNFILDQIEFIDTVVVGGAYVWLCCGAALFLVVPLFIAVLYIRGRSKVSNEEDF